MGAPGHSLEYDVTEKKFREEVGQLVSASGILPAMWVSGEGPRT